MLSKFSAPSVRLLWRNCEAVVMVRDEDMNLSPGSSIDRSGRRVL